MYTHTHINMFIYIYIYSHLHPISKTIQIRWTRHAGHCSRSKDELLSDMLLWTPLDRQPSVGQPARTYLQQLCVDTGHSLEDLPKVMDDRDKWKGTVREIHSIGMTSWWLYIYTHIYIRINMGVCVYIYIYIYAHTCIYTNMYIHISMHTHIYSNVYTHTHIYI